MWDCRPCGAFDIGLRGPHQPLPLHGPFAGPRQYREAPPAPSFPSLQPPHLSLNPAIAAPPGGLRPLVATACGKSGCYPEGDLRGSWESLTANPEQGAVAAELPDLG